MAKGLAVEVELANAAIDGAGLGICVVADDGRLVRVNRSFAACFGIVREDQVAALLGAQYGVLSGRFQAAAQANSLFRAEQPDERSEHLVLARDGRSRALAMSARTVVVGAREALRVVTAQDITNQRSLASRLATLQRQVDALNGGVVITDATSPDNAIVHVNQAFLDMTGYARAEVIGRNCRFLQGDDRDQSAIAVIREAIAERRSFVVTLRNYRKDGTPFVNELFVSPVAGADGRVRHYIGFQRLVPDNEIDPGRLR